MITKGVIVGPWVGEFGWELFSWQAYCRAISRKYDVVVAISRPGNEYLYSDFCDYYVPYSPPPGISDSHSHSAVNSFDMQEFLKATVPIDVLQSAAWSWLQPSKIGNPPYDHWRAEVNIQGFGGIIPEYKLYRGTAQDSNCHVVFHARNRQIRKNDNWSIDNWNELQRHVEELGLNVACIGTKTESSHITGALDFREKPLEEVCGLLRTADVIVGPSSGPMHLASLSGCPQVVWTSNPKQNYSRYKYTWNPFCVDMEMIENDSPTPQEVVSRILKIKNR